MNPMPTIEFTSGKTCVSRADVESRLSKTRDLQHGGEVYLTFDDGPLNVTLDVLDVLSELNVKATFFVYGFRIFGDTGENLNNSLQVFKRLIDDEHVIANHNFDHMHHNSPSPVKGYNGRYLLFLNARQTLVRHSLKHIYWVFLY